MRGIRPKGYPSKRGDNIVVSRDKRTNEFLFLWYHLSHDGINVGEGKIQWFHVHGLTG